MLQEPVKITLKAGAQTLNLQLTIFIPEQSITVQENNRTAVSTDSNSNASAQVLKGQDLDALGDSPKIFRRLYWLSPAQQLDRVAVKSSLTASAAGNCHRKTQSARFGSTRILLT